ncbi:hypothetical protein L596_000538 [Steinernema carpocapsae]|uniref:Uncharacterized protein n=1 Tax=Steinernema carpocapsae TaxID=34508 RepID=A0A4V6I6Y0_STECR|nr:hypothetical protein L596_000538 [Steinernema carpocapsae]
MATMPLLTCLSKEFVDFIKNLLKHDIKGLFYLVEAEEALQKISCGNFSLPFTAYWNLLSYKFPFLHKKGISAWNDVGKRIDGMSEKPRKVIKEIINNLIAVLENRLDKNDKTIEDAAEAITKLRVEDKAEIDAIFPRLTFYADEDAQRGHWKAKLVVLEEQYRNYV